jgi:aldehyde:ferredoxin oxidoreductase
MSGYAGRILMVDLTNGQLKTIPTHDYSEQFLGGRGIAVKLLFDLQPPKRSDATSPENPLIFMTGPLTGTLAPSSGRIDVVTKSPETGLLGGANAGGFFGPELKYAGYDGLVVTGRAPQMAYIEIYNDEVEIKDAREVSGKGVQETVKTLRGADERTQVACIGPAGERLVNLSGIAFGTRNYAARCGVGAVMGSKNLKAICVRGTKGVPITNPDQLQALADQMRERIKTMPSYRDYPEWHHKLFRILESDGKTFFGNYEDTAWKDRFEAYDEAERFIKTAEFRSQTCFGCPLRCWAYINVKGVGGGSIAACQGTLTSLANFPKIKDFNKIWKAYLLMQDFGMDTSGTAAVVAFAMDLYSKGILKDADVDGIDLSYGNGNALISMVEMIGRREGLGDVLADGVKAASEKIGRGAESLAVYGKGGLGLWLMEVRPFKGVALSCAVTDSGSQNRATYGLCEFYYLSMKKSAEKAAQSITGTQDAAIPTKYDHKPALVAGYEDLHILADSLGVCAIPFMPVGLELWGKAFVACTGKDTEPSRLKMTAKRIRTLERLYNIQQGMSRKEDALSNRLFDEQLKDGPWAGEKLDHEKFEQMVAAYYALQGWDDEGRPTPETLKRLGLT